MEKSLIDFAGPGAIAFSGGGDSTALMHALRLEPSIKFAFIIDHGLRDGSAEEAEQSAERARSYGYDVRIDRWKHAGVTSGIQAKAREYRYAALGRMCRDVGIRHLITAHTEDDQAETLLMRLDRQTGWRGLAGMPQKSYGTLWPGLAGITLHRPWLMKSRSDLRAYNKEHRLEYFDDPSNENTDFARIRARQALAADPALRDNLLDQQKEMRAKLDVERLAHAKWLMEHSQINLHGDIETDAVPPPEVLLHILNTVSGRGGPIDVEKRARLCRDMDSPVFKAGTLGGAWVLRSKCDNSPRQSHGFVYLRDRVAVTGRADIDRLAPQALERDVETPWDGRFLCRAKVDNIRVEAGRGHLQKLRQLSEFNDLFEIQAEVRETLPIFFYEDRPIAFGTCETEYIVSSACSASRLHALYGDTTQVPI